MVQRRGALFWAEWHLGQGDAHMEAGVEGGAEHPRYKGVKEHGTLCGTTGELTG